ncbi:hypothetical protein I308_100040 [Cryptococcus tetragattii IND107]|uniref:Chromatin modification-related protein EAF7 n=1 Tax=Cryptococcus tetragattii IND107 TaxID=1296105 RepID=A0ABR3C3P2_9TREE|nr:hypothetical protein I308_04368 [Cryptococcus tetragattii IND107]
MSSTAATASVSPTRRALSPAPAVTDLDLEIAMLRCLGEIRPLGRYKHFLIIQLQTEIHRRTGSWLPIDLLWQRLDELYDLEGLDEMASSSSVSIPSTPHTLSPRFPLSPQSSISSLSDVAPQKAKSSKARNPNNKATSKANNKRGKSPGISKSARIINSEHFHRTFDLPYFKSRYHLAEGEEERCQEDLEDESDSDEPRELDGEEERIWQDMIYSRALAPDGTDDSWGGDSLAIDEDESDDEDMKPKDKRKGKRTSAMSIVSRRESAGSGAGGEKDGGKRGKQTRAQEESEEDSPSPVKRKGARESNGADVKKPKRRR